MPENTDNKGKYLLFESAKELLAFDIKDVIELGTTNYIHRLPHKATTCILGIANINGDLCIILNLAKLLNLDESNFFVEENLDEKKLILCKSNSAKLAFLIDDIHHLSDAEDVISDEDEEFSAISSISVFRVANITSRAKSYTILDLELLTNALERNYL
ncbi:MAG: chemotaxis protein CheW [Opitutales bacterium]